MTVIRLPDGGVFLHSPGRRRRGDARRGRRARAGARRRGAERRPPPVRGRVEGGVSAGAAARRAGAAAKRADLALRRDARRRTRPCYAGAIDQLLLRGAPYMNEIAFLHRASRTLLLTDFAFHPTPRVEPGAAPLDALTRVRDGFGPNALVRLSIRDRARDARVARPRARAGTSTASPSRTATCSRAAGRGERSRRPTHGCERPRATRRAARQPRLARRADAARGAPLPARVPRRPARARHVGRSAARCCSTS